jgi:hypothetical protein
MLHNYNQYVALNKRRADRILFAKGLMTGTALAVVVSAMIRIIVSFV